MLPDPEKEIRSLIQTFTGPSFGIIILSKKKGGVKNPTFTIEPASVILRQTEHTFFDTVNFAPRSSRLVQSHSSHYLKFSRSSYR